MSFPLGRIVGTASVVNNEEADELGGLLRRHVSGDWGDVDDEDKATNDYGVVHDLRILSSYTTEAGHKVWIITEADRSVTTVLYPEDY